MHMLIADDNVQITDILMKYAHEEGYDVDCVHDGLSALRAAEHTQYDVILLDVMMPHLSGFDVCKKIRQHSSTPIIMISAKVEEVDRILGLDIGADDYVTKPFSPGEVMARVRAVTRRRLEKRPGREPQQICVDNLQIQMDNNVVLINGQHVSVSRKELDLLWTLASYPNKVFTRENLLNALWGIDYFGDVRTVDSQIKRLRAKLDQFEHPGWRIKTVWGIGYRFETLASPKPSAESKPD
ncbi:MAG: response regulator transcription factor [Clostridia bacterium]|nr:response regulator transcription factor [Clostridia bacterium]